MSINMNNYEEWMVAFIDNELSAEEIKAFNVFLGKNPALKEELADYKSMTFEADAEVVFENKEVLYKNQSSLVLLKKAWPLAAAIALLLCILPFLKDENPDTQKTIVQKGAKILDTPTVTPKNVVAIEEKKEESFPKMNASAHTQAVVSKSTVRKIAKVKRAIDHKVIDKKSKQESVVQVKEFDETPEQNQFAREVKEPLEQQIPENIKQEKKAVVENKNEIIEPLKQPIIQELEPKKEKSSLVVISKETTPVIHDKLNEVVTKVEDNIETIKKLKKAPITVSIGKRKLFTLNN